ncbi:uncharacterized protein LOC135937222 isoform X1 [Cloeon dipterum]|uniref:uncharacterized protein LOC135937222 isoform X1 n=1 Tax=Cloeon dipterum TaxID=197152 RepID=UPI00321FBAEF
MVGKVFPIAIFILILVAVSVLGKQDRNARRIVLIKPARKATRRFYIIKCCGNYTCSGRRTTGSGSKITNLKPTNVQPTTKQKLDAITSDGSADGPGANEGGTENQQEGTDPSGQEIATESPNLNQKDEPSASVSEISNNPEPDSSTNNIVEGTDASSIASVTSSGSPSDTGLNNPSGNDPSNPSGNDLSNPSGNNLSNPSGNNLSNPSGNNLSNPSGNDLSSPSTTNPSNPSSTTDGGANLVYSTTSNQLNVDSQDYVPNASYTGSINEVETQGPTTIKPSTTKPPVEQLKGAFEASYSFTCVKNQSLFDADGSLKNSREYGSWEVACGEQYIFGNQLANFKENFDLCCSIGMLPIMIDNAWKHSCLMDFIDGPNWKYNVVYWSTGKRASPTSFVWYDKRATFSSNYWQTGQPSNTNGNENCVMITIFPFNEMTLQLNDRACDSLTPFSCVGPTTPKPKCAFPQCPTSNCTLNPAFHTVLSDGVTSYLTAPNNHGSWTIIDYRTFMISKPSDTKTLEEAFAACCALDFKLLSLEQGYKYSFLARAFKNLSITSGKFWTSGSDGGCEGKYGFCSTRRFANSNETFWMKNEPDDAGSGNQNCLAVNAVNNQALLSDEPCSAKLRYICEGRSTDKQKAHELECMAAYGVTAAELATLWTNTNPSPRLQCFMKCYGEHTDLFIDGWINEPRVYSHVWAISRKSATTLEQNYATMDTCTKQSKPLPELCSRASGMLDCGLQKSPTETMKLVDMMEPTIIVLRLHIHQNFKIIFFQERKSWLVPTTTSLCPNTFRCVINPDWRDDIYAAASGSTFSSNGITGTVTVACGKRFFVGNWFDWVPIHELMSACCSLGMRLLTIDSQWKANCVFTNNLQKGLANNRGFTTAAVRQPSFATKNCFSDQPFSYRSWMDFDATLINTVPSFALVNFANRMGYYYKGDARNLACESL